MLPVYYIANAHIDRHICTHIHTYRQFSVSSGPDLHVLGLWKESGAARGHPHTQAEHAISIETGHIHIHHRKEQLAKGEIFVLVSCYSICP